MPVTVTLGVVSIIVLLGVSAFFSSTEIAIFSLPPGETGDGDPHSEALARLRENPHRLLVTILVGNNVVNVAVSSIVTLLVAQRLSGGAAAVVATLVASMLVLVFGEIIPKSYGLGNAENWALRVARPMTVVSAILYPVVAVFDGVTRRMSGAIGGDVGVEKTYEEDA
jgi:CBS domain containing-hemolysin-like protein